MIPLFYPTKLFRHADYDPADVIIYRFLVVGLEFALRPPRAFLGGYNQSHSPKKSKRPSGRLQDRSFFINKLDCPPPPCPGQPTRRRAMPRLTERKMRVGFTKGAGK
jgi:hypothetical protein